MDDLRPMVEQIADKLAADITGGRYAAGERVREQEIADRFGVSRGPIREALRVLERENLVELTPWRGARVRAPSRREIEDALEIRGTLVALAARLAATRGDDRQFAKIAALVDDVGHLIEAGGSARDISLKGQEIGLVVYEASGNKSLMDMGRQISRTWRQEHSDLSVPDAITGRRTMLKNWRRMAAALSKRDGKAAEEAMLGVIQQANDAVRKALNREGEAEG
jgi:DNA-binding GntR family transcriptional regulator